MQPGSSHSSGNVSHRLALPPGFELEGFRFQKVLGKGGFGLTYLAMDTALNVRVAIKELLPDGIATRVNGREVGPQMEELASSWEWALCRFEEEARMLAQLHHPNIVRVLRLIRAHGTAYMVMQYIEGQSFAQWMAAHPQADETTLRSILDDLLNGLEYVHKNRLLHRDISPENIFITESGKPVLLDFGSARQDLGKTMSVTAVVRHGYSPFEQYQVNSHQGPFTDLYALAGVMATAMTGHRPPPATDRISNDSLFPPLSKQTHGRYSPAFCHAIDCAFAVPAQDRPQTVAAFRRLLDGAATPRPKPAVKPTGPSGFPAKRPANRSSNAGRWVLGILFTCATGVAIYLTAWVAIPRWQQETDQRERQRLDTIGKLTEDNTSAAQEKEEAEKRARQAEIATNEALRKQLDEERRRLEEDKARAAEQRDELARLEAQRQRIDQANRMQEEAAARQREADRQSAEQQTKLTALTRFVNSFMSSLRSDDASDFAMLFDTWSDYKYWTDEGHSGRAPRSFIEKDRNSYLNEYTRRSYAMLDNNNYRYTLSADQSSVSLSFGYSYDVSGPKKARSGRCVLQLQLRWTGYGWIITSYDETVYRN